MCTRSRRNWIAAAGLSIAVPGSPRGVRDVGRQRFAVLEFRDVRRGQLKFRDGHGPDLVHAFTPRGYVRHLTPDLVGNHSCPYVVHLEDNEMAVLSSVVGAYDPAGVSVFIEAAAGTTDNRATARAGAPGYPEQGHLAGLRPDDRPAGP